MNLIRLFQQRHTGVLFINAGASLIFTIVSLLSNGFYLSTEIDRELDRISTPSQNNGEIFDFIIVGAGSSGSALASRLSEKYSVLVLEAGGTPSILHSVPAYALMQVNLPSIDWCHETVPQKSACFGLNENTSLWPAGKVLGGSSLLNAMMYIRGNVQGFDDIAKKTGDQRWKMSNILKYYTAIEDYNGWFENDVHGRGGPMKIEQPDISELIKNLMKAGKEMGYSIRDPNNYGPYTEGFANLDLYMHKGRRSDAYHEFLLPVMTRNNLVVRRFSHVTQILFRNTTDNEAYGVEYKRHAKNYVVKATREVIISAGSVNTAQILMLSGVGPKQHLSKKGIHTRLNLPVGQQLQDQYGVLVGPFLVNHGKSKMLQRDFSISSILKWLQHGRGPIGSSLAEATWAIITETAKKHGRTRKPDIHSYIITLGMPGNYKDILIRVFNLKPDIYSFFSKASKQDSFFQLVTLNNPGGTGTVMLRDANPLSKPLIDPRYLENEDDMHALVDGVKMAVHLVENTTAMNEINARLMPEKLPGCEDFHFKSEWYYECIARHVTLTAYKFSGTTPIGKNLDDPDAVVDSHLRVLGTKNLRVVGGSVLQQKHTSINDVTCRMLGIFAADLILEDWGSKY